MNMKVTFIAAAAGLALLVLGSWFDIEELINIGTFVLPLSFLWGGLFGAEQSLATKVTLLVIAGVLFIVSIQMLNFSGINLGSLFGR